MSTFTNDTFTKFFKRFISNLSTKSYQIIWLGQIYGIFDYVKYHEFMKLGYRQAGVPAGNGESDDERARHGITRGWGDGGRTI